MGHTIAQIKALLKAEPSAETLKKLQDDPRKGVQTALKTYYKQKEKQAQKLVKFKERLRLEKQLWSNGVEYVAGIDEVGRGPLAGPVVTAAVILPHDFQLVEVNDSKQLSEKKREELYDKILEQAVAVAVGIAENELIDEVNIYQATRIAMKEALEALTIKPGHILIDAMQIDTDIPQTKLIKGDARLKTPLPAYGRKALICAMSYRRRWNGTGRNTTCRNVSLRIQKSGKNTRYTEN